MSVHFSSPPLLEAPSLLPLSDWPVCLWALEPVSVPGGRRVGAPCLYQESVPQFSRVTVRCSLSHSLATGMWRVQGFACQSDIHQFRGEVPSLVWPSGSSSTIFPGLRLHLGAGVSEESPGGVLDAEVPSPTPLRKSPTEVEAGPPSHVLTICHC